MLFGDVHEYRQGGIERLKQQMERRGASRITTSAYDPESTKQQYIFEPAQAARNITRGITEAFTGHLGRYGIKTQARRSEAVAKSTATHIDMPPLRMLHLLVCVHKTQRRKNLLQDRIESVESDQELFYLIRRQLSHLRSQVWAPLRMRALTGIHFTRVSD
jgi:hypothetical protein